MSFFKKMKERLFKSSSKLDDGLNALVEEGDEVEETVASPRTRRDPRCSAPICGPARLRTGPGIACS